MLPSFPKGASLDSILLACHWLLQSKKLNRSDSIFFGDVNHGISALAHGANEFAKRALGGTISGRELAMHNSAWPVYSSLLPQSTTETCLNDLISSSNPAVWHQFFSPYEAASYAQDWRACPACCREDTGSSGCGVGHWRVIHQLPGVTFCPRHLIPLQYRCSGCKSPLGGRKLIAMPAWPCLNCGGRDKDELQANLMSGSKALVDLYAKLLSNEDISLSPAHRGKLHQKILGNDPTDEVIDRYVDQFLATFGFSDFIEMGVFLGINITKRDAYSAVRGGKSCPPPLNLALSSFAINHANAIEPVFNEEKHQSLVKAAGIGEMAALLHISEIAETCRLANDSEIPTAAVNLWIQGAPQRVVCNKFFLDGEIFSRFVDSLPFYLRDFLGIKKIGRKIGSVKLKEIFGDGIKKSHREKIGYAISLGADSRVKLRKLCAVSYRWCLQNDNEWLAKVVPRKYGDAHVLSPEERRNYHRNKIRVALEAGIKTRVQLRSVLRCSYGWCRMNDTEWLDGNVPRYASDSRRSRKA